MKRYLYLLFCFSILLFAFNPSFALSNDINRHIQSDMKWALKRYHLAGISVSYTLSAPSAIQTLGAGYANMATKHPITSKTYFEVGSITKAFVSSIIMQQITKTKISLDETLSNVAKKYPGKDNRLKELVKQYPHLGVITLRQYLTHTSGIPQAINTKTFINAFNKNPMQHWSEKELIAIAMQHKPYFSPGEKNYYGYTNTDYIILGLVIEAITGKSLAANFEALFSQLALNNIYFPSAYSANIPKSVKKELARAYITKRSQIYNLNAFSLMPKVVFPNRTIAKEITPIALNYITVGAASGGLIAQTRTLVKWYWLLFHGQVIPQNIFPKMLQGVPTADPSKKYGLAIVVQRTKQYGTIYSHDGNVFGYAANLLYVPKLNLVLAVAVNTSTKSISPTLHGIVGRILQTFAKKS